MYLYRKKLIGFLLFVVIISSAFTFAKDDCSDFNRQVSSMELDKYLSSGDIEIARDHLRSYCCVERPELSALSGHCENLVVGPESPYRYDHLIDVLVRKLDSKPETLYPDMEPDILGEEWQDFITDPENIKTMDSVKKAYKEYWLVSNDYINSNYILGDYSKSLKDFLSDDKTTTLHDKYLNSCLVAMMIYYKGFNLSNVKIVENGYYGMCLSMIKDRVRKETSFALTVSQHSAAKMLADGMKSYTKQFVQNRLIKLNEKIVAISSLFNILARQAPLSDRCMK